MAKKKENSFETKARKKNFLKGISEGLDTKHNVKNTILETGKDLLIGVIGGGLAGAAIGKPSLLIGIGVAGAGHFMNCQPAKLFGLGLMASNGFQDKSLKGLKGMDGIKERVMAYKENFADKLYIKALLHKKHDDNGVNGVAAVQYFNYKQDLHENNAVNGNCDEGERQLDYIDNQIAQSGFSHMERKNIHVDDIENDNILDEPIPAFHPKQHTHHHEKSVPSVYMEHEDEGNAPYGANEIIM